MFIRARPLKLFVPLKAQAGHLPPVRCPRLPPSVTGRRCRGNPLNKASCHYTKDMFLPTFPYFIKNYMEDYGTKHGCLSAQKLLQQTNFRGRVVISADSHAASREMSCFYGTRKIISEHNSLPTACVYNRMNTHNTKLTARSVFILEKLSSSRSAGQEIPHVCGTQRFTAWFTRSRYWTVLWVSCIPWHKNKSTENFTRKESTRRRDLGLHKCPQFSFISVLCLPHSAPCPRISSRSS